MDVKPSARNVVAALLKHGDVHDVTAILLKIGEFRPQVYFQNHMELCLAAKEATIRSAGPMPEQLRRWATSRNFWRYVPKSEQSSVGPDDLLPIRNLSNRPFFIRLLAHVVVGSTQSIDDDLLSSFLHHDFTTIASAAAVQWRSLSEIPLWG